MDLWNIINDDDDESSSLMHTSTLNVMFCDKFYYFSSGPISSCRRQLLPLYSNDRFTHSMPFSFRGHSVHVPFPRHSVPLIHTCHAAPLPCSESALSFVKVHVVASNISAASPTVNTSSFLYCAATTLFSRRYGSL